MSTTELRDLRTGCSIWDAYPTTEASAAALAQSTRADVVILGAGITGALVAEALTSAGLSTLIVDRRMPARGSTAASTALLQYEIDTPLLRLAEQIGLADASRAWRRSWQAVSGLRQLAADFSIPCAFRTRQAIYLAGNRLGPNELAEEARLRASIGLPSRFLDRSELLVATGMSREAAVLSDGAADVNPVQLTHGLLRLAVGRGARLHAPVEVSEVVPLRSSVGLATSTGVEIEAKALIFATGYELANGVPAKGHRRSSTWAFATVPQPQALRSLGETVLWEASDPYLYIRSTIDGRVVVGGEDEDFDDESRRDALISTKVEALQNKTSTLLPWLDLSAEYSWAGTFGESETGLPSIGPVPDMPHCYAVLGYGGNGITFGYLAARLLAGYLTGQPDPDAELFAFGA